MRKNLWIICAALAVLAGAATVGYAVDAGGAAAQKGAPVKAASADKEAAVRQAMQKAYPGISIQSVTTTPLPGIYEVFTDGQLIYTDEKASYLFISASLIDTAKKSNLTSDRMSKLTAIKFDQLPLDLAFKKVKGKGERKMAIFSDPDCPFCKRIEGDLTKIDNVTIYMFLFPIDAIHPQASVRAKRIWCSPDRAKAWDDLMQRGILPVAEPNCDNPVDKLIAYGNKHNINGTPTLIFADGARVPGAIPTEQIEQYLASARPK